jgi:hypothetical protein
MFGAKFPKRRPKWLISDDGRRLELDGYCELLALAFEHQGGQHYKNTFGVTKKAFNKLMRNDKAKVKMCSSRGITLIQVPEVGAHLELDDLEDHILERLKFHKYDKCALPEKPLKVDISKAYVDLQRQALEELQAIAEKRGGECLSGAYNHIHSKLEWRCEKGHKWEATPASVKKGRWCIVCAGKKKFTINQMHKMAKERGGKCLSENYVNSHTELEWQCGKGHRWSAKPCSIKQGSWCPNCSGLKKLTSEEMQEVAKERGGKCLSKVYKNNRTKLKWQCEKGHTWTATPHNVKTGGTWCPQCAGNQKGSKKHTER